MSMMPPPASYPIEAFHAAVRDAIWEVLDQVQAPDALVAGAALTAMAIACQANVDVMLPSGLRRPSSLYTALIGQSGERKTTVDDLISAPIYAYDQKHAASDADMQAHYRANLRLWQATNNALQRKIDKSAQGTADVKQHHDEVVEQERQEPDKPVLKQIIYQSITERPLLEALHGRGKSIAILSDEGEIVLKSGAMKKMGNLNRAWDGKPLSLDLVDVRVRVVDPRITISFMVQEEVIEEFLGRRGRIARGSGHLARYLIAWPASTVGFRKMTLGDHAWTHLSAFHQRITELLDEADLRQTNNEPRTLLKFCTEAKELWAESYDWIEKGQRPGERFYSIKDFACKMLELAGRVAAILHYFNRLKGEISRETLQRALTIVGWHLDEFNRLFGDTNCTPQIEQDVLYLGDYLLNRHWLRGEGQAYWNEVRTHCKLRDQMRFEAALRRLEIQGAVEVGMDYTGSGKGKRVIILNPFRFQQAAMA
ncbi:YfjI family protein [Rhodanobacter thiooxydans]|uniref:YfjI family protein n=1 Tax=Rhodanobacter thiooxydans TaxID=416169 RepID=UPI000260D598|nr:YfjI family protein [Rhodanobacter thiooxydans]EIM03324.1 hypothetical protein UUA_00215 [Rhodanobacter thiooxydans LCS2]